MGHWKNLLSSATLSGNLSYFDYQYALAKEAVIPWLARHLTLDGWAVGDFGCHQGGFLQALRDLTGVGSGMGFDLSRENIEKSPFCASERFRLEARDILSLESDRYQFDLVLIQDTLDHIPDYARVLAKARDCLRHEGYLFVTFPPYFSPFGGHQHESANWARFMPFLHYLPEAFFFRMVRLEDDVYMSAEGSLEDLRRIRRTRLTLSKAEKAIRGLGLRVCVRDYYLLRPEFRIRYGLPAVRSGLLGRIPGLREICVMGAWYLVKKEGT